MTLLKLGWGVCLAGLFLTAALPADEKQAVELQGRWTLYFYVPKGTKQVAGYADGPGALKAVVYAD